VFVRNEQHRMLPLPRPSKARAAPPRDSGVEGANSELSRASKARWTPHPDNAWMTQIARNVTDTHDGFLRDARYLIMDRDTKYSDAFRGIITRAGTNVVRLPPRSLSHRAKSPGAREPSRAACICRCAISAGAPTTTTGWIAELLLSRRRLSSVASVFGHNALVHAEHHRKDVRLPTTSPRPPPPS
jgi:hypothetical protein